MIKRMCAAGLLAALTLAGAPAVLAQGKPVPSPDPDAPNAPAIQISNGLATAVLYVPDAQNGYYRATRFDWSGAVADLRIGQHSYFGRWNPVYDPKRHDAISGPVQEFVTGQGFDAAPVGGSFVKIGVGVLRKPAEPIRGFPTLEIIDGGRWTTTASANAVTFTHEVNDPASGYGYRYRKTLTLTPGKPQLVLSQHIESTGIHPIDTEMYDHNFFVFDKLPSGPDVEVRFPFTLTASNVRGDAVKVGERQLNYLKTPETPVRMVLSGFGPTAADYDIRVENKKVGAGVKVTASRPLSDFVFWSSSTVTSPEAYLHVHAERGKPMDWTITYDFYTLPGA